MESSFAPRPSVREQVEEQGRSERFDHTEAPIPRAFQENEPQSLQLIRLGDGPDILLPGSRPTDLYAYVGRLRDTQLFPTQDSALARVQALPVARAKGDDGRPLIGIVLSEPRQLLPQLHATLSLHVARVEEMGGRPVLLPPMADLAMAPAQRSATIRAQVTRLDGLLGPGGADVHPAIYGAAPTFSLSTNYRRDRYEADLSLAAMDSDCFMLGICRSHQLWNGASGGTLFADTRENGRTAVSQNQLDYDLPYDLPFVLRSLSGKVKYENRVVVHGESDTAHALGTTHFVPNSAHHQAVAQPGAFRVVATAYDTDTGKRTIEMTERWNALTVQFHPEFMPSHTHQRRLYDTFGRRSGVFRMLREQNGARDITALERRMRASGRFVDADFRWLRAHASQLERVK